MAKVARLNVMITANARGLSTGVTKAKASLGQLNVAALKSRAVLGNAIGKGAAMAVARGTSIISSAASKMSSIVTGAVAGIGIAATAAAVGLVALTKAQMASVDANAKASRRLGITYNELKAVQLAAGRAGIEAEVFNKGFERMLIVVSDAAQGNKAALEMFRNIGLSFRDIKNQRPFEMFQSISKAINSIPDPYSRVANARDFFSRSGGQLLELFRGGSAAIEDSFQKIQVFGTALNDIETKQIENANDRIDDMLEMLRGVGSQLATKVSPLLEQVSIDSKEWIESMGGMGAIVNGALAALEEKLFTIEAWTSSIADGFGMIYHAAQKIQNFLPGGRVAKIGTAAAVDGAGALYDYGQEGIKGRKNSLKNPNAVKSGKRGGPTGVIAGIRGYVANAEAESLNRVQTAQQDEMNAPAVEAAKQQRQAEQRAMYDREQYRQAAQQQEAMRRMAGAQRRGFVPSAPLVQPGQFSQQRMATGGAMGGGGGTTVALSDTDRQLLRGIQQNTGKNNVAYAG